MPVEELAKAKLQLCRELEKQTSFIADNIFADSPLMYGDEVDKMIEKRGSTLKLAAEVDKKLAALVNASGHTRLSKELAEQCAGILGRTAALDEKARARLAANMDAMMGKIKDNNTAAKSLTAYSGDLEQYLFEGRQIDLKK